MSVTRKSLVFLGLAFAISWAVAIGGHFANTSTNPSLAILALQLMMTGPAIAALACALLFEKGRRLDALGLRFKPNWWWLYAWLIPLALALASVLFTTLLSSHQLTDIGEATIAAAAAQSEAAGQQARAVPHLGLIVIASSIFVAAFINAPVLVLTEELGWRGYLHDLWRPFGFWRASLATGAVWGLWHAPAILLYGLNYPQDREIGVPLFVLWCMLLSPIMTLVRDRGGATWAAGILHGTINAVGGLTILALSAAAFPWYGIVGIGGFLALALGVTIIAWAKRVTLAPALAAR